MPLTLTLLVQEQTKIPVSRVKSLAYSDGYPHVATDGINPLETRRSLRLRPLRRSSADSLEASLTGLNGNWFYWTPNGESQDKFRLLDLQREEDAKNGNAVILSLTVEKVYIP